MSTVIHGARQRLVDEMLVELEELGDRRNELLREMFRLARYGKSGSSSALLSEEDFDEEELECFLERFDLRKNPQTGSILGLDIPELKLETGPSRRSSPFRRDEEFVTDVVPSSDDVKHADNSSEFQYPNSSPLLSRAQLPKVVEETGAEEDAMDVDMPAQEDKRSAPDGREEPLIDIEVEEEPEERREEPRTPPRTRARTRTKSPVAAKGRKRRRSDMSEGNESAEDAGKLQVPTDDVRQTRSRTRKPTPPPPVSPAEDDDVDELDIISLSSPRNVSSPRRRISPRQISSQPDRPEAVSTNEVAVSKEQARSQEGEVEEEPAKSTDVAGKERHVEQQFVPQSPSTPSVRSASSSSSLRAPPPEKRESPIRAPKPREPHIVDTTPLTPPRSPPPPIVVHLPVRQLERPVYHFIHKYSAPSVNEPEIKTENEPSLPASEPDRPRISSVELRLARRPAFNYSLPPLSALPPEFNRKGKPTKSRKRDKERERSGSDAGRKDDWVPLGMAKWAALLVANPAYKKLSRATKCVSTRDWNTASTELKLIRTLERIDVLKRMGKWSFRQLKKQRVAAGLVKTHWDYLMDEMKWMQVDFREERRWKLALAYELALSVQEWHAAGSHEERIRLGICARWRRPDPLEPSMIDDQQSMDVDIIPAPAAEDGEEELCYPDEAQQGKRADDADASDNEDDDVEDQAAVTAALIPDNTVPDIHMDTQQPFTVPDPAEAPSITMKLEEVEEADALHLAERADISENYEIPLRLPQDTTNHWAELPKTEILDASQALRSTSNNPAMDVHPGDSAFTPEAIQKEQKSFWTPEQTKVLRSSILSLSEEDLFVSMDEFVSMSDEELMKSLASEGNSNEARPSFDLNEVFPELQPFSLIDVPNSEITNGSSDGKKKSDRKADKDDPTKRVEETTYTKLCPTSRFMHVKPTLVSALQPAKKWRKGRWIDLDESPVVSDIDSPPPLSGPENGCTLFEGRKISIPFQPPLILHNFSKLNRNTVKTAEIPWSQAEDNLLNSLTERYPSNWRLVADALNSSRIRTSIDLRTPQECFDRWRTKCGIPTRPLHSSSMQNIQYPGTVFNEEGAGSNASAMDAAPPPSALAPTSQMTTRGIKRLATSAAQNALNLSINTGAATVESRKRKRHLIIYEAVRKTLARRQKQRKQDELKYQSSASVAPVHDTHNQIGNKTRYTPLELSRIKAERERKEMEAQMSRRREIELKRQQQQQQLHQLQQAQQQQQQQMSQQGVALPQSVPQIRTQVGVSQHQQQILPIQSGNVPLSPQMMQQVQARALAQAQAQAQAQQAQVQPSLSQLQGQMVNGQPNINGAVPHLSAQYVNHGGANSPVAQHSSPPRSGATPVNSVATFPRPSSAQRNVAMQGTQILPMAGGSVPIARTNNVLAAYFANSGVQYTPEQMTQLMRYQQAAQQQQLQMQQQQQQPVQMQMQAGQQNLHQGGMAGYPPSGQ